MPYLHCPSCGLTLAMRGPEGSLAHCPRCQARRAATVPMRLIAAPGGGRRPVAMPAGVLARDGKKTALRDASAAG